MTENFVKQIDGRFDSEANVYSSIFDQYERVVIQSLITSFGLDFLVKDQHGGDVDTVHNVRQIGKDKQMTYKNKRNEEAYNNRGEYNRKDFEKTGTNYQKIKSNARNKFMNDYKPLTDEYTGKNLYFSAHSDDIQASLDHIVAAKEIHEDRGRVLSGLNSVDLADSPENFTWTNNLLNKKMQYDSAEEYIAKHPELDEQTKQNILEKDKAPRKAYNDKINRTYYTSPSFFRDSAKAASKVGIAMGMRQALGLVFSEIWFAVKDAIKQGKEDGKALFNSIAKGVKKGFENAKARYKELWHKFLEGAVGGILASLTTTICNIFFTTAKNLVRIIRQSWASLVEATKILLFNPDLLPFGERFRAAAKIIATGASIVVGTMVGDMVAKTGIATIPLVGDIVVTFCGTMITGIMSCSLLYLLDRNPIINRIVQALNSIPTVDDIVVYYRMQAQLLDQYCAKLMDIDLITFQKETKFYNEAVTSLENANSQQELNLTLKSIYKELKITSPIGCHADMDSFMADKEAKLKFC